MARVFQRGWSSKRLFVIDDAWMGFVMDDGWMDGWQNGFHGFPDKSDMLYGTR